MKSLSGIVLNFFELFEAEGRLLREKTITTGNAIISIFAGVLFLFAASILLAMAVYIYLSSVYDEMVALIVLAASFTLVGIILLLAGRGKR